MEPRQAIRNITNRPWVRGETLCVYCGAAPATTRDHVVPQALYTAEARQALGEPLAVPACQPCNAAKSRYDEPLRNFVLPDVDVSDHPDAAQLLNTKMLRAVAANRVRLLDRFYEGREVPVVSPAGLWLPPLYAIPIDGAPVRTALSYIVRGLHYLVYGERLDAAAGEANVVERGERTDLANRFFALGTDGAHEQEPAFAVAWNGQSEQHVYWLFGFYNQLLCLGRTAKPNPEPEGAAEVEIA